MKTSNNCDWAVCYDISGVFYDDGKPYRSISAWFEYPSLARDFIDKVLPEDTKSKFYVMHRDQVEKEARE